MSKKVLCVVSEHGFWAQELLLPLTVWTAAGIDVRLRHARPAPSRCPTAAASTAGYVDPPLGRPVTSPEMEERGPDDRLGRLLQGPAQPAGTSAGPCRT